MPIQLAVVCEAEADYRLGTALAERVLCDSADIDWVDADFLLACPLWHGDRDLSTPYFQWKHIGTLLRKLGLPKPRGHFGDDPGAPDADAARTALFVLRRLYGDLDGVLLLRDDDRGDRRRGLEQARSVTGNFASRIVIGLAKNARESWVLAGFEPQDDEREILHAERQTLGYDPRVHPERLHTRRDEPTHSAKRVLTALVGDDRAREERCWTETSLALLRGRGEGSGLRLFLDEVAERLVPLFVV